MSKATWALASAAALLLPAAAARAGVAGSKHDLSVPGGGAASELCVYCHTPHDLGGKRGLWNPQQAATVYTLYGSTTLRSTQRQPTGRSRLCLACHDGTTAPASPTGGAARSPLTGSASLGTDLSDDHPVSMTYDPALASQQGELANPATLPRTLRLDGAQQVQCGTCHDPHQQSPRKFLRMDDRTGALCSACHRPTGWSSASHATSGKSWKAGPLSTSSPPYATVAENACESCHRPHAAGHAARLLREPKERAVCLSCHDGTVAAKNLAPEFAKASAHSIGTNEWTHDPAESPSSMSRHVACMDCHDPHQAVSASAAPAAAPAVPGPLRGAPGLTVSGSAVAAASYEYEVCLRCHGVRDATTTGRVVRQDSTRNIRTRISPSNGSFHPIADKAKAAVQGSLEPGYSTTSILYCTDCHNNEQWTPGGTSPRGPHGSSNSPLLARNYTTADRTAESAQAYALCYKCHTRASYISKGSGTFLHQKHVVSVRTPCAVCHDAHGSRNNPRLIDFMLRDRTGQTVVSPSRSGRLEFVRTSAGHGRCYLTCHTENHEGLPY